MSKSYLMLMIGKDLNGKMYVMKLRIFLLLLIKEKHDSTYNVAQLRLWANMLQIDTDRDYDEPSKVPLMFGVNAKTGTKSPCLAEALSNVAERFMRALKSAVPAPSCSSSPPECHLMHPPPGNRGFSFQYSLISGHVKKYRKSGQKAKSLKHGMESGWPFIRF